MRNKWLDRRDGATDIVAERINLRFRELVTMAIKKLIEDEMGEHQSQLIDIPDTGGYPSFWDDMARNNVGDDGTDNKDKDKDTNAGE